MEHGAGDVDGRRSEQNQEEGREDAEQQWEEDLDRQFLRSLLGTLPALDAHFLGLDMEHLAHRDPKDVCLDHRKYEGLELGKGASLGEVSEGVAPCLAKLHLLQDALELLAH